MNFKDGIILPTKALRKCGPYLEKYFGITLGYFNVGTVVKRIKLYNELIANVI